VLFSTNEDDEMIEAKDYRSMENVPVKKIRGAQRRKILFFLGTVVCIVIVAIVSFAMIAMNIPPTQQAPKTSPLIAQRPSPTVSATGVTSTASATGTASSTATKGATSGWKSIFDDEFNGQSLDTTKWMPCYHSGNCTNSGNGEQEWYFPDNVSVNNGILTLSAEKKTFTGPDGKTYHYASGMISSVNFSFTYGYVEMRAKIAAGKGMWSAFWTLPTDGSWPPEIDVQETLGRDPTVAHMRYHYGTSNSQVRADWQGPDFSAGWHTFAIDWEPDAVTWYIDGVARGQDTNAATVTNKPMYLLANLAVGAPWPGVPDATTVFPAKYEIDYIRVWQRQSLSVSTSVSKIPGNAGGESGVIAAALPVNSDKNANMLTRTQPALLANTLLAGRSAIRALDSMIVALTRSQLLPP
jgi:Beta-glucanase/Beta-glucan synthetase